MKYPPKSNLHSSSLFFSFKTQNLEGKPMNRIVVIEFPTMQQAENFYLSDEYKKGLKYINFEVADRFLNIAEAVD